MPQNFESLILDFDEKHEDGCRHISLNCPRTITSKDEILTVIISCLEWTFNFDFCVRLAAHPQGTPHISKQLELDNHHPLHRPLTHALNLYRTFPETHLNTHQLDKLGELIEYLEIRLN